MSETLSAILTPQRRAQQQAVLYVGLCADAPRTAPARLVLAGVDRVELGRGEKRDVRREGNTLWVTLADGRMSRRHARLLRDERAWTIEDLQSKNGTWVGAQRVTQQSLAAGDMLMVGHTMLVFDETSADDGDLLEAASSAPGTSTMSAALAARFAELAAAARSRVSIEIHGETGTGKELAARAVHEHSGRTGRFVAVNCGALPGTLLEAELFGHKKGAFTGAGDERAGFVRSADGGTLFLDEVAELPPASQAALLRVLQEGEIVPLGSDRPIKVDVRVVTATHKRLEDEVAANRFRADLRARLLGMRLVLPPLRERREDLALVVAALLERVAPDRAITFSADAAQALYLYEWPLNIRELERALAMAVAVVKDRIELVHLPDSVQRARAATPAPVDLSTLSSEERALRDQLAAAIARYEGNLAAVARELGKDRTQIRRWMKRFGLGRERE